VEVPVNPDNHAYLLTKVNRMDHMLALQPGLMLAANSSVLAAATQAAVQSASRQEAHEPELAN